MRRREFIALGTWAASAWPYALSAQPSKVFLVGLLSPGQPIADDSEMGAAFLRGMAERGYAIGRNLAIERRGAMFQTDKLPGLAQELAAAKVDVIVTNGIKSALAAKATGLPTVAASGVGDPVVAGLVDSLAHPGGNVTGISDIAAELSAKRFGLLREIAPTLRRVAILWNQEDAAMTLRYEASAEAAERLGIVIQAIGVRGPSDIDRALAEMKQQKPDALLMVADTLLNLNRKRVFDFTVQHRVPAIYEFQFLARDGGLMSYGADLRETYERAAALVDRILRGTKPADLPFEQATRYVLVMNLKTARAMGLDVPPTLLARADEVIE